MPNGLGTMHVQCNVSASQGAITSAAEILAQATYRALGSIYMPRDTPVTSPAKNRLVPLRDLPGIEEIDTILRRVIKARRKEVNDAIEEVLEGWPGRKRGELWDRLRQLRQEGRETDRRHAVWSEEDLSILRTFYSQGRAGARLGVKELLARHPDWNARQITDKAGKLGISSGSGKARSWSREEHGYLLWNSGEKPVGRIARKLGRSEKAVRHMLSSLGASSKVRSPKEHNLHGVSKLLGVSDTAVRLWFRRGLFGQLGDQKGISAKSHFRARLTLDAVVAFCAEHPDKINADQCDPDLLELIEDRNVRLSGCHGTRQHLVQSRRCLQCGRVIRGNAYFRHLNRCKSNSAPAGRGEMETANVDA